MIPFTIRNFKVFFRDRSAVFFSFMGSLIMIGLYILFLGDTYSSSFSSLENAHELMDNWVMAGPLATTSVSATVSAFSIMVNDQALKINKDFYSSPASRKSLALGYVTNAFLIGFVLSVVTLIAAEIYITANGGSFPDLSVILKILLLILLTDLANTAMMFFITSFFSGSSAFSAASTIIGTLIGFVTGIYLPIGMLPDSVQWVIKLFPTSHGAALLRQTMLEDLMSTGFTGLPQSYLTDFKNILGVTFQFGSHEVTPVESILILFVYAAIFFSLASVLLARKKKA